MRERAGRIGGELTLLTSATTGTEVRVVVPGRIVFRTVTATRFEKLKAILRRMSRTSSSD